MFWKPYTETVVIKVINKLNTDSEKVSVLLLLNLNAAIVITDHRVVLDLWTRLDSEETSSKMVQFIHAQMERGNNRKYISERVPVTCGVAQG